MNVNLNNDKNVKAPLPTACRRPRAQLAIAGRPWPLHAGISWPLLPGAS